ncbi:MAG: 3-phosphoglycerate dehydrogenase, partial [Crocinitomicaceae bacterium]|nr:3-phosphoglycerate dehydrogenase [Crocinitomicaceae bacterium]
MKVLANDGISQAGVDVLTKAGFTVSATNIAQENLINEINATNIEVLLVRSATTVREDLINACPNLKLVGRG